MLHTAGKHILRPLKRCLRHLEKNIVAVAWKWCAPNASDVFLSKNDNSGGKNCEST